MKYITVGIIFAVGLFFAHMVNAGMVATTPNNAVSSIDEVIVEKSEVVTQKTVYTLRQVKAALDACNQQINYWQAEKVKWAAIEGLVKVEANKVVLAPVPIPVSVPLEVRK